jgi:hypothetical protein
VDGGGGLAGVADGVGDEAGAADEVAAGEHAGHAGHLLGVDDDGAPVVDRDPGEVAAGRERGGFEAVGDEHDVGGLVNSEPATGTGLRRAAGVGRAEFHAHAADGGDLPVGVGEQFDRVGEELEAAPSSRADTYSLRLPGMLARSRR